MEKEFHGIVFLEKMSIPYFLSAVLLITASFCGLRSFLITIPLFCYIAVSTYIFHPLNTNLKGYEYIINSAQGFFSGAGTVEPGYTFIIFLLKSISNNIQIIYVILDILVLGVIVYAYRIIVESHFKTVSFTPLATIIAAYFPILFVFQQRSGTALGIVLLAFSLYENIKFSLFLFLLSVSIHIQSLSSLLFYLFAYNSKAFLSLQFRLPTKLSRKHLATLILLVFTFVSILILATSFLQAFALTQGLRYMGMLKYQGLRLTGFITLLFCVIPFLRSIKTSRLNFFISLQPNLFDTIIVSTFMSSLIINIVFSTNLHFATRFSRPFDFLLLTCSLYTYIEMCANRFSKYILALGTFSFLYFSWVF